MANQTALERQKAEGKKSYPDIAFIQQRHADMKGARTCGGINWEAEWKLCDEQYQATTYTDNDGNLIYNSPIEQNILEFIDGGYAGDLNYNIIPKGDADVQQTQSAKYALAHFLDEGNFYQEQSRWDHTRGKYGTAVFFCGMTMERDTVYSIDAGGETEEKEIDAQIGNGFFHDKYKETERETWNFAPKNVPIQHFYIDDKAMNQPDFEKAEDCIMQEYSAKDTLMTRWKDVPGFDQEELMDLRAVSEAEDNETENAEDLVKIWYYYNKITKDFCIVANENQYLYHGKMLYRDSRLPFALAQFYPNDLCMYGYGVCKRVRTTKAYKNNMMQYSLDGARLNSSKILSLGGNTEMKDGDLYADPGNITLAQFSSSLDGVGTIDTRVDINSTLAMTERISDEIRQDTGYDIRASFEAPASTLGQTEIIEENKQTRQKTPDNSRNQALDKALTMCLRNIADFAPVVMASKVEMTTKDGKKASTRYQYPMIRIKDVKVSKKKGNLVFEEDMGKRGFYEFAPKTLSGELLVTVVTASTQNKTLKAIEKNRTNEMIQNLSTIGGLYGAEEVAKTIPLAELWKQIAKSHGYDTNGDYYAMTKKDEIEKENARKMQEIQEQLNALPSNLAPNVEQAIPEQGAQAPSIPAGGAESEEQILSQGTQQAPEAIPGV